MSSKFSVVRKSNLLLGFGFLALNMVVVVLLGSDEGTNEGWAAVEASGAVSGRDGGDEEGVEELHCCLADLKTVNIKNFFSLTYQVIITSDNEETDSGTFFYTEKPAVSSDLIRTS